MSDNSEALPVVRDVPSDGLPAWDDAPLHVSLWLWHVPSSLFIVAVVVGRTLLDDQSAALVWEALTLVLVAVATGVATLSQRHARRPALELLVPPLLLAAAFVGHGSGKGTFESTILLAGLPAAWLAFAFAGVGLALAVTCVVAVGLAPFAWGAPWPTTKVDTWDQALPVVALVGMAVVTHRAGQMLQRARARVHERSAAVQREISTSRAIVQSVDAAIAVFVAGEVSHRNAEAVEMYRRAGASTNGTGRDAEAGALLVLDADRHTPTPFGRWAPVRAQRGEEFSDLVQWVGAGEDQRAIVCSSTRIPTADGDLVGNVFVGWDATDLLDSMRVRDEFLGTVGHELRTPLAAILGYLELQAAESAVQDTAADGYLDAAMRQVIALSDRIEDLLAAAMPREISSTGADIVELTRTVVSTYRDRAERLGVRLDLDAPEPLVADVNEAAYAEIVENLVDNALKFTPSGSVTVTVGSEPVGPGPTGEAKDDWALVLDVEDTGVGMNAREADRVFDPFYRTAAATRLVVPGLGIGLAVTRQLVHAHGGSITVRSTPGEGSRFRVTIPVVADR